MSIVTWIMACDRCGKHINVGKGESYNIVGCEDVCHPCYDLPDVDGEVGEVIEDTPQQVLDMKDHYYNQGGSK